MFARFFIPAGIVVAFVVHQLSAAGPIPVPVALFAIVLLGAPVLFVLNALSQQIELTDKEITRRGLFGTNRMAMSDIISAHIIPAGRGSRMLSVQSEREKLVISTLLFSHAQLEQIQEFVAQAGQRTGRTVPASQTPKALTRAGTAVVLAFSIAGAVLAIVLVATFIR